MKFKKQYTARTRHGHGAITLRTNTNTKSPRAQLDQLSMFLKSLDIFLQIKKIKMDGKFKFYCIMFKMKDEMRVFNFSIKLK
jgi:hypothetical protein